MIDVKDEKGDIYNYFDLIDQAKTKKEREGYIDEALLSEPDNLRLLLMKNEKNRKKQAEYLVGLANIVSIGNKQMQGAIKEGERLLELCKSDNLGVRYDLMHLFTLTEDKVKAEELFKAYDEEQASQMMFPLCFLYYKIGETGIAKNLLFKIKAIKEVWTEEMLDMLVNSINTDPRGEKYRDLDWSNEYEAARKNPNDTQTAL